MKHETNIQNEMRIQLQAKLPAVRLFRNNNGRLRDRTGQYVTYGLGPGTSDLIGYVPRIVTPEMVGALVAVFCAIEVKSPITGRPPTAEQLRFINAVRHMGGLAGVARSLDEALNIATAENFAILANRCQASDDTQTP